MDDLVLEDDWGTELTVREFLDEGELRMDITDLSWFSYHEIPLDIRELDELPFIVLNMGDVWKLYKYLDEAFSRRENYLKYGCKKESE